MTQKTSLIRGEAYGELRLANPQGNMRRKAERTWALANDVLSRAVGCGVLDRAGIDGDIKSWSATNHDLYGISADGRLVCVQQRNSSNNKYGVQVQIDYFVTDGDTGIMFPNGTKNMVKRSAKADPTPDSPLRALRKHLPPDWQEMVSSEPVRYSLSPTSFDTGYKLLEQRDGALLSLWDETFSYTLGKLRRQRARDGHRGGLYYYATADECESMVEINWGRTIEQFAIVRCDVGGHVIFYESGKRAASFLRPVEITTVIESR